ncbi:MAG: polysaccharide pyruvyl transferase family protein, partial [Psychroflexus sp.]
MKILVIGQCTLHWGRMEFGNIGNFYIMEPFFRLLHDKFPKSEISTTFQMSNRFCEDEKVIRLPMSLYYDWQDDLLQAQNELSIAYEFLKTKKLNNSTPYIDLVKDMDLVIDFSGDIWGDNADFLGEDRFMVGLIKDRVAQIFANKTVMIAGSPGPFSEGKNLDFAKEVYAKFDLVTNREYLSKDLLDSYGFDTSNTHSLTCPAFRFEPAETKEIENIPLVSDIIKGSNKSIGFLICGWNFTKGPFDKWPRKDEDYDVFADAIEAFLNQNKDVEVYLMSHSNGFPIPPKKFELIHGRDYPIIKQLQSVLVKRGVTKRIHALDGIYNAWQTKAILGQFDMVISGRVHAAVGAMSQLVPTVIIDYGHEPKAHKLKGFAEVAGQLEHVAEPDRETDLIEKMNYVWNNREKVKESLKKEIPKVKARGQEHFEMIK